MRHFHEPAGLNDFDDPGEWAKASYEHHPCDDFEPLPDVPNPYRQAALQHLGLMYSVDQFLTEAKDARIRGYRGRDRSRLAEHPRPYR